MLKVGTSWGNRERLTYCAAILALPWLRPFIRWPVTTESRAQCQVTPMGDLWWSDTGTGFSSNPSISFHYCYSTDARHSVTDAVRNLQRH